MTTVRRILSTRIARNTTVGYYGLLVQLTYVLVSVPLLTDAWGLTGYGAWMLLITFPSLLAVADLGLIAAGGNAMTAATARGQVDRAGRFYSAARFITAASGALLIAGAALVLFAIRPQTLGFAQALTDGHAQQTVAWLMLYGFLVLQSSVTLAASRAVDAVAMSGALYHTVALVEGAASLWVAVAGAGAEAVALTLLAVRAIGWLGLELFVRGKAGWLRSAHWLPRWAELREILAPSLAAMAIPAAYAVSIQGSVMVIGAIGGPAGVPAFTTVRTLSRTALQFAFRLNVASMPRYTVFEAQQDRVAMSRVVLVNLIGTAALVIPFAIVLLAFGQDLVGLWTDGLIAPSFALVALLVAAMVLNGAWVPISNLFLAANRQASFAYAFLIASVGSLGLGIVFHKAWSSEGMAAAVVALELVMTIWVVRVALHTRVLDLHELRVACRDGSARIGWLSRDSVAPDRTARPESE